MLTTKEAEKVYKNLESPSRDDKEKYQEWKDEREQMFAQWFAWLQREHAPNLEEDRFLTLFGNAWNEATDGDFDEVERNLVGHVETEQK